jgi:hypothetical protein
LRAEPLYLSRSCSLIYFLIICLKKICLKQNFRKCQRRGAPARRYSMHFAVSASEPHFTVLAAMLAAAA